MQPIAGDKIPGISLKNLLNVINKLSEGLSQLILNFFKNEKLFKQRNARPNWAIRSLFV